VPARLDRLRQQVLGGRAAVARVAEGRPRPAQRLRRLLGRHARADVDGQVLVRAGDAELDHLRAEVVGVPVQPRLGVDGDAEVLELLVDALAGVTRSTLRLSETGPS
jgi:hypothetical protein